MWINPYSLLLGSVDPHSDDLSDLQIVMLGDILKEYNFIDHVATYIGVGQLFLPSERLVTQENHDRISGWTIQNKMMLKESKKDYTVFTRTSKRFATRLTLKNIARIAKHCPENITSVVKCVKLHFPKVLRK